MRFRLVMIGCLGMLLLGCNSTASVLMSTMDESVSHEFQVTVAKTLAEHAWGLQGVEIMDEEEGMWFVFEDVSERSFWMKDTLIPLDIVFVDAEGIIIHIEHSVPPCMDVDPEQLHCPSYASHGAVQYVLELNAGTMVEYGFEEGDLILTHP